MSSTNSPNLDPLDALRTQIELLTAYSISFDNGDENMALPMATALRVLLHDTNTSRSVLRQLGVKETVRFTDTADAIPPRNAIPSFGLAAIRTSPAESRYVARCAVPGQPPRTIPAAPLPFEKWWNRPTTVDSDKRRWSRRGMVRVLANKLGGAHVDPATPAADVKLSLPDSFGWRHLGPKGEESFKNSPLPPSIRQIAFEVLDTVDRETILD